MHQSARNLSRFPLLLAWVRTFSLVRQAIIHDDYIDSGVRSVQDLDLPRPFSIVGIRLDRRPRYGASNTR